MKILTLAAVATAVLATPACAAPPAKVTAADAWCRPAPAGALAGGCYVTLTASVDDRLTAVETTAADHGEIHTMSMDGGIMRMRKLPDGLPLSAGKTVTLKPGADHIMIIGPKIALKEGARVALTLKFQKAAPVKVDAIVRTPPTHGMAH